jgi:hypothetical protein
VRWFADDELALEVYTRDERGRERVELNQRNSTSAARCCEPERVEIESKAYRLCGASLLQAMGLAFWRPLYPSAPEPLGSARNKGTQSGLSRWDLSGLDPLSCSPSSWEGCIGMGGVIDASDEERVGLSIHQRRLELSLWRRLVSAAMRLCSYVSQVPVPLKETDEDRR